MQSHEDSFLLHCSATFFLQPSDHLCKEKLQQKPIIYQLNQHPDLNPFSQQSFITKHFIQGIQSSEKKTNERQGKTTRDFGFHLRPKRKRESNEI